MNKIKKDPWLMYFVSILSNIFALMTFFGFLLYITVSRQGISLDTVYFILKTVNIISLVSLILLFIKLLFLIIKDRSLLKKIKQSIPLLLSILLVLGIFIISNSIYVLSKGYVE